MPSSQGGGKKTAPAAPTGVSATVAANGDVTVAWDPVPGAQAYVVHYGDVGKTTKDAVHLGYTEADNFTLAAADVPAHAAGDKVYFYVQAFDVAGTGADDAAKAQALNEGDDKGSAWAKVASVTFE